MEVSEWKKNLREMIYDKGIKIIDLAKHLELSISHTSLIVNGKRRMNVDQAYTISTLINVSMDELYLALKRS